jgi:hypothetical protein
MIRFEGRVFSFGQVWFEEAMPAAPDVDVLQVRQRSKPIAGHRCTPFLSVVTDLQAPEAEIFSTFASNTRNEIRRALARDELEYQYVVDPLAQLETFCDFYDEFARQKSIFPAYRRGLVAACEVGRLALTTAFRHGEILVWHAYITSGRTTRLQHSASLFRGLDGEQRSLIARANRWQHWRDMLTFKGLGYERFCWGGLFEDETELEHRNINRFKRNFGGREERTFDCTIPVTVKGRVYKALVSVRGTLKKQGARPAVRRPASSSAG